MGCLFCGKDSRARGLGICRDKSGAGRGNGEVGVGIIEGLYCCIIVLEAFFVEGCWLGGSLFGLGITWRSVWDIGCVW